LKIGPKKSAVWQRNLLHPYQQQLAERIPCIGLKADPLWQKSNSFLKIEYESLIYDFS
jgi:hypothetical protein